MDYLQPQASGLRVSVLPFGAGTFGGREPLFDPRGASGTAVLRQHPHISWRQQDDFARPAPPLV